MTGRFAPSPTGDLHFGSLLSAVACHADARARGDRWLVRIENVDEQREVSGAGDRMLEVLARYGMSSDGPVLWQSERTDAYEAAVTQLVRDGHAFPCGCARSDLPRNGIYPGTCAGGLPPGRVARTVRLRVPAEVVGFEDEIRGRVAQDLAAEVGAFVIRRADGFHAYQLAVVLDDGWQQVDRIVRGSDLLASTPRQIHLQRVLGLPTPSYAHHPVAVAPDGRKLSKSWDAVPVDPTDPLPALLAAWRFLGQAGEVPKAARRTVDAFWHWALEHWDLGRVPARDAAPAPS